MDPQLWWHVARASGLTAWALLSLSVLWGLLLSTRVLGGRAAPAWLLDLHRSLGALTVTFTAVHMIGLYVDEYIHFGARELFVPLASEYRPWAVAWGVVAMYLLLAVALTSWARHWIPDLLWRWIHRSAFVAFALSTTHTLTAGTDARNPYLLGAAIAVCAAFAFLCLYRLLAGRRERTAVRSVGGTPATGGGSAQTVPAIAATTTAAPAFHPLRIRDVRSETADSVSVAFDVPEDLVAAYRFDPGQFLTLRTGVEGGEVRRCYSICSGIADGELRIGVRKVPGGRLSTRIVDHFAVGETVEVMPPQGRFTTTLNPLRSRRVLGVAAGSGITPVLSILRSIITIEPHSTCTLLLGNRDPSSVMLAGELDRLVDQAQGRFRVVPLYSRDTSVPEQQRGRIEPQRLLRPDLAALGLTEVDEAYMCGPVAMMAGARAFLEAAGVPAEGIHSETFEAVPAPRPSTAVTGAVPFTIIQHGIKTPVVQAPGETVLDAGLRAGLDLPYSCLAGSCGTCVARVALGEVDPGGGELTAAEREAGDVLTCQATACEESAIVDYDR